MYKSRATLEAETRAWTHRRIDQIRAEVRRIEAKGENQSNEALQADNELLVSLTLELEMLVDDLRERGGGDRRQLVVGIALGVLFCVVVVLVIVSETRNDLYADAGPFRGVVLGAVPAGRDDDL